MDIGRKLGEALPLWDKLGPYLTQCCLGRGLSPYQVASWVVHPGIWPQWTWAENWEGGSATFWRGGAGSPSNTKSPGLRPISTPSGHNRYGPKIGGFVTLGEGRWVHTWQCGQGRGLPACHVSSWSIQPCGQYTNVTDKTGQTTVW